MAKVRKLRELPPELTFITLDEIAGRLADIYDALQRQVPEGLKEEVTVVAEGTRAVPLSARFIKPPYFRAAVFNDGPDPVYVMLNKSKPVAFRTTPLNDGDKLVIDTVEAKIQLLLFACVEGESASVRVHLLK